MPGQTLGGPLLEALPGHDLEVKVRQLRREPQHPPERRVTRHEKPPLAGTARQLDPQFERRALLRRLHAPRRQFVVVGFSAQFRQPTLQVALQAGERAGELFALAQRLGSVQRPRGEQRRLAAPARHFLDIDG